MQGMGHGDVDLCQPIVFKITAKEVVTNDDISSIKNNDTGPNVSEVDIAIIIDDVINREPRFLQKQ